MKSLEFCKVILIAVALVGSAWAGKDKEEPQLRLELDMVDGSHISGTPSVESVPVQTSYAKMDVPLKQILAIKMGEDHETAALDLQNGDKLKGVVSLGPVKLETVFGKVKIGIEHIRELRVVPAGGGSHRKGLVLWNRLESERDVQNSRVGPGGKLNGGRFVPGRFGKGVELNMQEQFGVTFPVDVVPTNAGCIEFWAKLVDFPQTLPWGAKPGLIGIGDKDGTPGAILHLNGNDGASNGGLCARLGTIGSAGTGQYGSWTYAQALSTDAIGDWHHYALVWNPGGIPGVLDGTHGVAVFVDGRLNTGSWNGAVVPSGPLLLPEDGRLGLLSHQGLSSGRVVFDNLKIWNYAKTDFSNRTDE